MREQNELGSQNMKVINLNLGVNGVLPFGVSGTKSQKLQALDWGQIVMSHI